MFKETGYKYTLLVVLKSYIRAKKKSPKKLSKIHKMANVCSIKIYCSKNLGPITFWDSIFHKLIWGSFWENIGAEDKPCLLLILLDISKAPDTDLFFLLKHLLSQMLVAHHILLHWPPTLSRLLHQKTLTKPPRVNH